MPSILSFPEFSLTKANFFDYLSLPIMGNEIFLSEKILVLE